MGGKRGAQPSVDEHGKTAEMLLMGEPPSASILIGERRVVGLRVRKVSLAAVLLQLLVALHLVAPISAAYSCSSDADCEYPGCNNRQAGDWTRWPNSCEYPIPDEGGICMFDSQRVSSLFPTRLDLGGAQRGHQMC